MTVGEAFENRDVLVDEQDRLALGLERRETAPDLGADRGGQALGGLVEDEEARIGHQGAADGQHLLFAAGEGAGALVRALGQDREHRGDAGERPWVGAVQPVGGGGDEVFADGERGEDLAAFGDEADAETGDGFGCAASDVDVVEADGAGAGGVEAHDGADGGGLAHAVAAHEGDDLALAHGEVHVEEDPARAVGGLDAFDGEHQASPSPR